MKSKLEEYAYILDKAKGGCKNIDRRELVKGTHLLKRAEVGIGQNIAKKPGKHLQTREGRGYNWLGNRKKES